MTSIGCSIQHWLYVAAAEQQRAQFSLSARSARRIERVRDPSADYFLEAFVLREPQRESRLNARPVSTPER